MYLEAEKQMKMFKSCLTTQEIFSQQKNSCQGLTYHRIPIPDFCAPKEQVPQGWDGVVLLPPSQASPDAVGGMSLGCSVLVGCLPRAGGMPRRCCVERLCALRWARIWHQGNGDFNLEAVGQRGPRGEEVLHP